MQTKLDQQQIMTIARNHKKKRDNQRHARKNDEKHMIITIRSNRNETNKDTQT